MKRKSKLTRFPTCSSFHILHSSAAGLSSESSAEEAEGKKRDFKERFKGVKVSRLGPIASFFQLSDVILEDKIVERLPQDQKTRAAEHVQRGKHFLTDEYFPAERRDQFIYRGKKVIVECQKHPDYQDAIKWLLSVAEQYAELGQGASEKGKESVGNIINVAMFLFV